MPVLWRLSLTSFDPFEPDPDACVREDKAVAAMHSAYRDAIACNRRPDAKGFLSAGLTTLNQMSDEYQTGHPAVAMRIVEDNKHARPRLLGVSLATQPDLRQPELHLQALVVRPEARRAGVGSFVVNRWKTLARDENIASLTLNPCIHGEYTTEEFYKKHGFRETQGPIITSDKHMKWDNPDYKPGR